MGIYLDGASHGHTPVDVKASVGMMDEQELYDALGEIEGAIDVMMRWGLDNDSMFYVRNMIDIQHQKVLGIYD